MVLFLPAELFVFFTELVVERRNRSEIYNASLAVGNLLQVLNFAANFVVYCTVYARRGTANGDSRTKRLIIGAVAASSGAEECSRPPGGVVVETSKKQSAGLSRLEQRRCAFVTIR